jgi:RHS repeat-associated protein
MTISLPNGTYPVAIIAGDAANTDSTNNFVVNGQTLTDPDPATESPPYSKGDFDGWIIPVTVTNGTLTITAGSDAVNPKLCLIEIGAAGQAIDSESQTRLVDAVSNQTTQTAGNGFPEVDAGPRSFVYGTYVDEVLAYTVGQGAQRQVYYPHYNHLYSPAALTDASGVVVERYSYNAYGKQTITSATGAVRAKSAVGWDRGFTGYVADIETGLLHARARQYSPTLGRFVGRDALYDVDVRYGVALSRPMPSAILGRTKGFSYREHPYAFANNSPSNYLDPDGFKSCTVKSFSVTFGEFGSSSLRGFAFGRFVVEAEFGECCECCRYKQEIRGYFRAAATRDGEWVNDRHDLAGVQMDPVTWHEDATRRGMVYGDRDFPSWNRGGMDEYGPTRATGCFYRGADQPSLSFDPPIPYKAEFHLEFMGSIIDTCTGETKASKYWTIDGGFEGGGESEWGDTGAHSWVNYGGPRTLL